MSKKVQNIRVKALHTEVLGDTSRSFIADFLRFLIISNCNHNWLLHEHDNLKAAFFINPLCTRRGTSHSTFLNYYFCPMLTFQSNNRCQLQSALYRLPEPLGNCAHQAGHRVLGSQAAGGGKKKEGEAGEFLAAVTVI